jgi:hypothetical protein
MPSVKAKPKVLKGITELWERSVEAWKRGDFFTGKALYTAFEYGTGLNGDYLNLTREDVRRIYGITPCPCGDCRYYAIEVYNTGRVLVHHQDGRILKDRQIPLDGGE